MVKICSSVYPNENYELYKKENLLDAKYYLLSCIEKNIDKIDNESLKNAFFLRIKDLKK